MYNSNKKTFLACLLTIALLISNFGILGLSSSILAEEDLGLAEPLADPAEPEAEADEPEEKAEAAEKTDLNL